MEETMAHANSIKYQAKTQIDSVRHSNWLETLTRIGFACKGIVYFLVGVLALMAALGNGGETTDQRGVMGRIAEKPLGEFALGVIAAGLFAYALWRFLSAIYDTEGEGSDKKGIATRIGYTISGFIYSGFAYTALRLVMGDGSAAQGGNATQTWTARLLNAPGGTFVVIAVGVGVIAFGISQIRNGWKEKFMDKMRTRQMSATERDWCAHAGKAGYAARGVVFAIVGTFLVAAALRHNPGEVRGLEGALDTLSAQPFGPYLLGLVSLGLAGYGIYSMFAARYRTVRH
jgi:hypothetical protein